MTTSPVREREFRVTVLAGSQNDLDTIDTSPLFQLLDKHRVAHELEVVSSDREPERLRSYCIEQRGRIDAAIAIAGGVPNLPICTKAWMPEVLVISVPLGVERDYALAALTTPGDVPVVVAGFGTSGLEKAARIVVDVARLVTRHRSNTPTETGGERALEFPA